MPSRIRTAPAQAIQSLGLATQALRTWTPRHVLVAFTAAIAIGLAIGIATVLIPNPLFGRDIPPVWWNYPVWVLTSALSGMLIATYVRADSPPPSHRGPAEPGNDLDESATEPDAAAQRTSRMGIAGGILAWFAVGCPVCNKIALLALGYSGAITWFAPMQPFIAMGAMLLTGIALVWRLRGQVACPIPPKALASVQS